MDELEVAFSNTSVRTDCNHIFLNFVPTVIMDPSKVSVEFFWLHHRVCRVAVEFYRMAFTSVTAFRLSSQFAPWWCAMAAVCGSSGSCRLNWRSTFAWHQPGRPFLCASFSLMSLAITWTSASTRRSPTQVQARWGFIFFYVVFIFNVLNSMNRICSSPKIFCIQRIRKFQGQSNTTAAGMVHP